MTFGVPNPTMPSLPAFTDSVFHTTNLVFRRAEYRLSFVAAQVLCPCKGCCQVLVSDRAKECSFPFLVNAVLYLIKRSHLVESVLM
jgi:hypothetical protein